MPTLPQRLGGTSNCTKMFVGFAICVLGNIEYAILAFCVSEIIMFDSFGKKAKKTPPDS